MAWYLHPMSFALPTGFAWRGETVVCEKDGSEMVYIPAGEFWIGADGYSDAPWTKVYLSPYLLDRYPVTNAQYRCFINDGGYENRKYWPNDEAWRWCQKLSPKLPCFWDDQKFNGDSQPVVGVSWYEATAYCCWAGKQLPSEAQWVKAARGGIYLDGDDLAEKANLLPKRTYPWGDESPEYDGQWRANCYAEPTYGDKNTSPVGEFPAGASPYGCQDMVGNIWEWCYDWYGKDSYPKMADKKNLRGPEQGLGRVVLGGSWFNFPDFLDLSRRNWNDPDFHFVNVGFRCAEIF